MNGIITWSGGDHCSAEYELSQFHCGYNHCVNGICQLVSETKCEPVGLVVDFSRLPISFLFLIPVGPVDAVTPVGASAASCPNPFQPDQDCLVNDT